MKISYNWLKQYVPLTSSPAEVAEMLTMAGLEVEDVETVGLSVDPDAVGSMFEGVVVGEVRGVRPHPNADRLTLCDVDLGRGELVQIACGAPNVAAGQKAPVATVGATLMLPDRDHPEERTPVKIRKAKIRGEVSEGMICAEDELGLSGDHSGIMVLQDDAVVGEPFADYFGRRGTEPSDAILDVSITPNRPDAVSHIGVARDVAALTGADLQIPPVDLPANGGEAASAVNVEILTPDTCPRYVALLIRDVRVTESPGWLKQRLTSIGLRPRNNIVDITNFVMYECGQPLHAFDFNELAGATVHVRLTEEETPFTTLDGRERKLPKGTMMIADGDRDVAIAGVMGGENSEVKSETRNVLIESAYFEPAVVRRTAKALGMQTDASYRFERGVDRDGQVWAAARAAELMAEIAGGRIVAGMVDAQAAPAERRVVSVRASRIDGLLGMHVPLDDAASLLRAIGFGVVEDEGPDGPALTCTVPTHRPDVEREVDVIEEIVRLYGFDRIPEPARSVIPNKPPHPIPAQRLRADARAYLSSIGYREIYTNSMLRRALADRFNDAVLAAELEGPAGNSGAVVETLNPISQEMSAMRPSLLPGALQVMSFNRKHGRRLLRFFEIGHVYHRADRSDTIVEGYAEHESLIIAMSGPASAGGWDVEERLLDIFDLKGVVAALLEAMRLSDVEFAPVYEPTDVSEHHLTIRSGGAPVGVLARVAPGVADDFDLDDPVFVAEINWDLVARHATPHLRRRFEAVSRHPVVERDLAVVVDRSQPVGPLMDAIRAAAGDLLRDVTVFDLYEGEHIVEGRKSVAFSLRFGADRTLLDDEVDERVRSAVSALGERHGAELRT